MKKATCIFVFATLMLATASAAAEQTPTVKLGYGLQAAMPFSIKNHDWEGGPVGLVNGFGITFVLPRGWSLGIEPGVHTAVIAFQPNPQAVLSVSYKITDKLSLGLAGVYRYLPNYTGGAPSDGHMAGVILSPIFPLGPVTLAFPIGASYNTNTEKWGGLFSVKISFPLAAF